MPQCKKCSMTLKWKKPYKKGDRPVNLSGTAHNCEKNNTSYMIAKGYSKHDYKHCDLCPGEYGWLRLDRPEEIDLHMKTYHPNQEQRSWDYFIVED